MTGCSAIVTRPVSVGAYVPIGISGAQRVGDVLARRYVLPGGGDPVTKALGVGLAPAPGSRAHDPDH